jgi:hypothetical protein
VRSAAKVQVLVAAYDARAAVVEVCNGTGWAGHSRPGADVQHRNEDGRRHVRAVPGRSAGCDAMALDRTSSLTCGSCSMSTLNKRVLVAVFAWLVVFLCIFSFVWIAS